MSHCFHVPSGWIGCRSLSKGSWRSGAVQNKASWLAPSEPNPPPLKQMCALRQFRWQCSCQMLILWTAERSHLWPCRGGNSDDSYPSLAKQGNTEFSHYPKHSHRQTFDIAGGLVHLETSLEQFCMSIRFRGDENERQECPLRGRRSIWNSFSGWRYASSCTRFWW